MLHPDKVLGSGDNDKIYISNRVFSAMTDAFNLFKKEVGMKWDARAKGTKEEQEKEGQEKVRSVYYFSI